MDKKEILDKTKQFIFKSFNGESTGHDYYHIERVVKMAAFIAEKENADLFTVELAAWLHDVGDHKLNGGIDKSKEMISHFLSGINVPDTAIASVTEIVSQVSFSKGKTAETMEAKIVQDADRLDAIGAMGLVRVFTYGGSKSRELYHPDDLSKPTTINHFYDKLLRLKDLMNTPTARRIAEDRHQYMEDFLQRFYQEWEVIV
ncbi:MAG: HD domain-containing protein [Dysgonamonadaceae bacterium]